MNYQEFRDIMSQLFHERQKLEATYFENGGEVTEDTESKERVIALLKQLLKNDGIDFLGRWHKNVEDEKKAFKAEKDFLQRQIDAVDNTLQWIKKKTTDALAELEMESAKGVRGYSVKAYLSTSTTVNKEVLNDLYKAKVEEALKDILPADVTISIGASVSKVEEGEELPVYYERSETPSVKFTKPRANKDNTEDDGFNF